MDRCNAHIETGQVVRCQTMKTFIRQQAQLVGDQLWKVEPVQRVAHGR